MARSSSQRAKANWTAAPRGTGAKRANPEHKLQMDVKRYLMVTLPPGWLLWTASMTGANLSMQARVKAKAAGVQRGWPDLQFLFPDGVTRYIELKADGSLSAEQRDFRDYARPLGVWALCRSLEEVRDQLLAWGAPLRERAIIKKSEAA